MHPSAGGGEGVHLPQASRAMPRAPSQAHAWRLRLWESQRLWVRQTASQAGDGKWAAGRDGGVEPGPGFVGLASQSCKYLCDHQIQLSLKRNC